MLNMLPTPGLNDEVPGNQKENGNQVIDGCTTDEKM